MSGILTGARDTVTLGGEEYKINTDFRVWIEIESILLNSEGDCKLSVAKILALAYPVLPPQPYEAIRGIMWFYSGGKEVHAEGEEQGTELPCYDLAEDFDYIWGGFMSQYGIDLAKGYLHWWHFKALLMCLEEGCRFSKIVAYRSVDTAAISDRGQRAFYEKMKKRYRLSCHQTSKTREELVAKCLEELF